MLPVDRLSSSQLPQVDKEPVREKQAVWLKETRPIPLSVLVKKVSENLGVHSFIGGIEKAFEKVKELESLVSQEKKSPSKSGLECIHKKLQHASMYLGIISETLKGNTYYERTYGRTVAMLQYRLSECLDAYQKIDESLHKTSLQDLFEAVRNILPEVIPDTIPSDYFGLMSLGNKLRENASHYARENVKPESPLARFSKAGNNLNLIKSLIHEIDVHKARNYELLLSQASEETRDIVANFEQLAGFIPIDQKWVIYHLAESNFEFAYNNSDNQVINVRTLFKEAIDIACGEKDTNRNEIERDEYSPLSPCVGNHFTSLTQALATIYEDDKISPDINKQLSDFTFHLMQRVGSLNNSQPITDTLSTIYGDYGGQGTASRYNDALKATMNSINAYTQNEQALIRSGFLERNDLGFWVKNEYKTESNGRIVHWTGTFAFNQANGDTCKGEAKATLNLTSLDWLNINSLQSVAEHARTVASRSDNVVSEHAAVPSNVLKEIPNKLRQTLLNDEVFWWRVNNNRLADEDKENITLAFQRYNQLEDLLKEFSLSINKEVRKILFESSERTALPPTFQIPPKSAYSRAEKLGYSVKWVFAKLGNSLKNTFSTKAAKAIRATQLKNSLDEFNPEIILKQNDLSIKVTRVSLQVRKFYEKVAAKVATDSDKEKLLDLLVKMEHAFLNTGDGDVPILAAVAKREKNQEKKYLIQEEIKSLNDNPFQGAKEILNKILQKFLDEAEKEIEETVKEAPSLVEELLDKVTRENKTFSLTETQRKAFRLNLLFDTELAKRVERVALFELPLIPEDLTAFKKIGTFYNLMVEPIDIACRIRELHPILSGFLKNTDFKNSLDALSAMSVKDRKIVQKRFIEACLNMLETLKETEIVKNSQTKLEEILKDNYL